MKKGYLPLFLIFFALTLQAQQPASKSKYSQKDLAGFDEKAAWKIAQQRYTKPSEQKECFEFQMNRFVSAKRASQAVIHSTVPFSSSYNSASKTTTINLTPQNANCPDMGFETMNFNNWLGDTWTLTGITWAGTTPVWTAGIVTQGANNPQQPLASGFTTPTQYRHTLMTVPPTVNNPPTNCIGWDSIAVNPTNHLSGIPFVPPTSSGVTCRLGNAYTGAETERLRYTLAVSSSNSQITLSYAVVLQNPGHAQTDQPFFQLNLYDQNGTPITGCGNYQVDATMARNDPSFVSASRWDAFNNAWTDPGSASYWDSLFYKPWTQVGVDLTPYIGTNVTIEFRTADCSQGGHFGYAYVDASCSPSQIQVNMCPGIPNQDAIAPPGYVSYQWYGPNNASTVIPAPNGTNDTLTIINGVNGDVYYLSAVSANGCTTQAQAVLHVSTVGIAFTNSTPSCPGGNSGTADVTATGSPTTYSYTWSNSSGSIVSTTNPATGLAPGTYSVHVVAAGCGSHDTTVTVGIAPPFVVNSTKSFCGTAAFLTTPAGATGIQWYDANGNPVPAPGGTNDTLLANNTTNGQVYSVVYTLSGCLDSMRITLSQVSGGSLGHSGLQNVCVGATNGQAVVTMSTTNAAPYNWSMTGPGGYNQTHNGVSNTSYTLTGLSYGTYTVNSFDGMCFYGDVFRIDTIPVPVYLTVAPRTLCNPDSAFISYTFSGAPPTQCQVSSSGCVNASNFFVGPANAANTSFSYPTPFGNYWTKMRAQYIYTAAELTAAGISAGKINSIAFNVTQINGATSYPNFNISVGCTGQTTFSSFPAQTDLIPGLFNVYSNAAYNVVMGLNTFNFSQAYEWDGISNLVVEVCFEFPGTANYTSDCVVDQTSSSAYPSLTVYSDYDPLCAGLVAGAFYSVISDQMRPVATFGWCSSVAVPSMYTYNITPNTGVLNLPVNPPTQTILSPSSTTSYTFTTTSVVGNCAKKDTFTIFIVAPFVMHMPPPATFCSSAAPSVIAGTFTDLSTGAPLTIPATWSGPGISGNNGTGSAIFSPSVAGPGTHTLILSATGGSCAGTAVDTVNPQTSAQLTTPDSLFCIYDAAVQINAASAGGTWSGQGVSAAGVFTPLTAGVSSPYHTIKYVTNGGTPCADSSTIRMYVFAQPLVDFATDTTEGCEPNVAISFTSLVSPTGGTYAWTFGNGQTSTQANPQNVYAAAGVYSPQLIYTDLNGCKDTMYKAGLITVHAWQSAAISIADSVFCLSDPPMMFTATTPGGTWTGPVSGAGLFTPSTAGVTTNLVPPYHTITHIVNGGSACADTATIHVTVADKPRVDFTTDTIAGCEPNTGIQFTSNVSPLGGTYHWVFGGGATSTAANPLNTYSLAGTYSPRLTYIDPNGCKDSITKTALIVVHPKPHASFYASPDHTTILEPHIQFINTTPGTNNIWLWNVSGFKFATTFNTDYEFADPGTYLVYLYATNQFGCKDSVANYVKIDPDDMLYVPSAFSPNSDGFNDVFMAEGYGIKTDEGFKMSVYDRWGNKVFESHDIFKGWDGKKGGTLAQEDIYVYQIYYHDLTNKKRMKSGQVSLIK